MGAEDANDSGSILIQLSGEQVRLLPDDVRQALSDLVVRLREAGSVTPAELSPLATGGQVELRADLERLLLTEKQIDHLIERSGFTCPVVMPVPPLDEPLIVVAGDRIVLPQLPRH